MAQHKISLFGKGFVGGEFHNQFRKDVIVHKRNDYVPASPICLNFISTVQNYNVLTDPYLDVQTNIVTLIRILENARSVYGEDVEFNFISSWFVYGETFLPATEKSECHPKGFYSITKYTAEMLLKSYCDTFGMKYKIMRLANVLGRNDSKVSMKKNFTQYLIKMLLDNEPVKIYYRGDFFRDYIDVRDCARAIKLVMDKGNFGGIYNISNGLPIRFSDVVEFLADVTKSKSNISFVDKVKFHENVQVKSMYMSNKKLQELGYQPKYTVFQSLQDIVDAYRKS